MPALSVPVASVPVATVPVSKYCAYDCCARDYCDCTISEFGVPAVNLKIACDWERIGIKMIR